MKDGTHIRTTRIMSVLSAARAAGHSDASSAADDAAFPNTPFDVLQWRPPKPRRGPAQSLLGMLGHGDECINLARSGRIASCDCRTKPMEDPAVAVGLVLHYARTAITRGLPIPPSVIELLTQRVEEGDPTCIVVARWLDGNGLLDTTCKNADAAGRVQ